MLIAFVLSGVMATVFDITDEATVAGKSLVVKNNKPTAPRAVAIAILLAILFKWAAMVERHPFGGFKLSGGGSKTGGPDYLVQFMDPKVTTENTLRRGFAPDDLYTLAISSKEATPEALS